MKPGLISFLSFFFRSRYVNRWVVFAIDLALSAIATVCAISFGEYLGYINFGLYEILRFIALLISAGFLSGLLLQTHTGVIRHSSITEVVRVVMASVFKIFIAFIVVMSVLSMPLKLVIFILTLDMLFTSFFQIIFRITIIHLHHILVSTYMNGRERMLIYINAERAISIRDTIISKLGAYKVGGYIRFGQGNKMRLNGYSVFFVANQKQFNRLITSKDIQSILFMDHKDLEIEQERLVRYCERKKVKMLLMPSADHIVDGKVSYASLPQVRIEDLLGREEIKIDMDKISDSLKGKVVMVTGAAGSIGSEICRQLCKFDTKRVIMYDCAETPVHNIRIELEENFPDVEIVSIIGDVRIADRLDYVLSTYHPQIIFHAAAYKHVPLMEENPCEAVLTNVQGTRLLADMAVKYSVERFIMISTDKAVNPTNVMGASKRLAEIYVQTLSTTISRGGHSGKTRFITTRFGNVLGSNGSVIPRFREQLVKGGPLTVTHPDIIRYFMTIPEACRLVLEASVMGEGNEIFVFDMGSPVKIADLARRMIELAGLRPDEDIAIEYTGLRPGEKLYEELLTEKELSLSTSNEKIFRAKVREYNYNQIAGQIDQLTLLAKSVDKNNTVLYMKDIIPEYQSNNSEFEKLDYAKKLII